MLKRVRGGLPDRLAGRGGQRAAFGQCGPLRPHMVQHRAAQADGLDPAESEMRIDILRREAQHAERLLTVIDALVARLEPLRQPQPAASFIELATSNPF